MVGKTLSHYRILEQLGAGGMGEVYRAHDEHLDRDVALKVLPTELAESQERLDRFQREAKTLAALDHPNIVTIHSVESSVVSHQSSARNRDPESGGKGETENWKLKTDDREGGGVVHFLTMQLVEGQPLSELTPKGGMPLERIFDIAIPLGDALAAAHEKGVIHRDLKPGNIMVTDKGRVKVLDFGLAKLFAPAITGTEAPLAGTREGASPSPTQVSTELLTEQGQIIGTVPYMSPEQLEGQAIDARSDVFALGVVLYELATGERPFQGASSISLISSIVKDTPQPVDTLRADLPHHLGRVIGHCLEKDPKRRFQSALDVRNELADLAKELEIEEAVQAHADEVVGRQSSRRWPLGVVAGAALFLLIGSLIAFNLVRTRSRQPDTGAPPAIRSLAVLPFDNLMNDPEQDYFVEGMHEALITNLSKIGDLRVISRTSAMRYKDREQSIPEIARELDVDALIEGSVLRADSEVRITAQLIDGETDEHLWAESYDRDLKNVLVLLSEVARSIASEIEVTVTPEQQQHLAVAASVDPKVQEAYLKGEYYLTRFSLEHSYKSLELFQQAIELDPTFAPAYPGLANSYLLLGIFGIEPVAEVSPKAKEAALEALELDDHLAEAHNALGWINLFFDWDWEGAERAFGRALELNPNHAYAQHGYGDYLTVMGRPDEALAYVERGRQSDPMSPLATVAVAGHLLMARRYDEAIAECERLLELGPEFSGARYYLASALWHSGMKGEALTIYRDRWKEDSELLEAFDRGLAQSGAKGAVRAVAEVQVVRSQSQPVDPLDIADLFALAGEVDSALEWLEEAYQQRRPLILIKAEPQYDLLRSDARFDDLARRIGLPD